MKKGTTREEGGKFRGFTVLEGKYSMFQDGGKHG